MFKYYKGKKIHINRYFVLGGIHYSTFMDGKNEIVVETSKLEDYPNKLEYKAKSTDGKSESTLTIDSKGISLKSNEFILEGEITPPEVDIEDKDIKINTSNQVIDFVNTSEEDIEIKLDKVAPVFNVIAINKNNKETNLGEQSNLAESPEIKRLSLDHEAVIRVLDGAQKQHKGYKFKVVQA